MHRVSGLSCHERGFSGWQKGLGETSLHLERIRIDDSAFVAKVLFWIRRGEHMSTRRYVVSRITMTACWLQQL